MVVAKFRVDAITERMGTAPDENGQWVPSPMYTVELNPVTGKTGEDGKFWQATPSGRIELNMISEEAAEYFQVGDRLYVQFTRVEPVDE